MADFLFIPFSSPGHINPALPLYRELIARGDRVSVIVAPNFARAVERTGARALRLPKVSQTSVPERLDPVDGLRRLLKTVEERKAIFAILRAELLRHRPDLVVFDPMVPKVFGVARAHGVPTALFSTTYVQNEHVIAETVGRNIGAPLGDLLRRPWARRLHPWATEAAHDHEVVLVNALPQLQPAMSSFGERFRFLGPLTRDKAERRTDLPWAEIERRRVLLVSPGTVFVRGPKFFAPVIEAFRDADRLIVLSTGTTDPAALGPLPPNVIARRSVPQTALLEHCDVFLTHAGMNSTLEALAAGVPMILTPRILDQKTNARHIAKLGAGIELDAKRLYPGLLRWAVRKLTTDPAVRQAVHALRDQVAAQDQISAAASALRDAANGLCRTGHPPR